MSRPALPRNGADPPAARPWLALQLTLAVQTLATLSLSAAAILAPAVAPELGVAPERVGLLTATTFLVAMLAGLAGAPWVDRVGPVRMSQVVLLSIALGMAAFTLLPALLLPLGAAFIGIGYGVVNPAAAAILGRHAPTSSPGLFFSLKQAGVPFGVALAGVLMPLGLVTLGWRGTAWATAAAGVLLAALLQPLARMLDPPQRGPRPPADAWLQTLVAALRHPALRRLSLTSMAYAMAQQGFLVYSVALLTLELGLPLALAAGLLAASQVACMAVRVAMGHIADRWVPPHVVLGALGLAMAVSFLALGALPRSPSVWLAALVMVACGATVMGWNGVYFAQLLRSVPREALAGSSGGVQFFNFGGGMLGPFLLGQLLLLGGTYTAGYLCLGALAAVAGWIILRPVRSLRPA